MSSKVDLKDQAYRALSNYFNAHQNETIEIEVLPPAIQPPNGVLMEDGSSLGIPKKILALAFVRARELFFAGIKADGPVSRLSLEASRIILLFDPEYITAANFRKRLLLHYQKQHGDQATRNFDSSVDQEIMFLNSILTSPLHRQSKSPTLWYHRTWLLDFLFSSTTSRTSSDQFLMTARTELDAVMKAGERHPKNYYAWQYARRLFTKIESLHNDASDYAWKPSYHSFLSTCALLVKAWCCKNPSDISGWSFLLFLLPLLDSTTRRRRIVKQVLEYAVKLQSEQESLWVFLRTVLADTLLQNEKHALLEMLQNYQKERSEAKTMTGGNENSEHRVTQALEWIECNSVALPEPLSTAKSDI
jgi:hypothetical protein